jgi:6-phosphogluconolactonase
MNIKTTINTIKHKILYHTALTIIGLGLNLAIFGSATAAAITTTTNTTTTATTPTAAITSLQNQQPKQPDQQQNQQQNAQQQYSQQSLTQQQNTQQQGTQQSQAQQPNSQQLTQKQNPPSLLLFVGAYTQKLDFVNGHAKGIAAFNFDPATGKLHFLTENAGIINPSFLTIHPNHKYIYSVNDIASGGNISAFALDAHTGKLSLLNQQSSNGGAPCFIATDNTGKVVLTANYLGANVQLYPIAHDGKLEPASSNIKRSGSGPNAARQEAAHLHSITVDPSNRYALACDLGTDTIAIYRLDLATKNPKLIPHATATVRPGAGIRHLAFHPNGRAIYAISELDSTITAFTWDSAHGTIKEFQTISTIPSDFTGLKSGAAIRIHPSGKFAYASNRGHNSIAMYSVDSNSGKLTSIGYESTRGKTPRDFNIDPSGQYLLAANQDSDNIITYRIDQQSGRLTFIEETKTPTPVCLQFMSL